MEYQDVSVEQLKRETMALCDVIHNAECCSTNDLMRYRLASDELERRGIPVREIVTLALLQEEEEEAGHG